MAKRLSFDRVREVLDVGCGVGHWGQLLIDLLPTAARVQGVDRDPGWVEHAVARASARGLANRVAYQVADGERVPFADASFDLVTCQTVLIHTADPGAAIAEMIRVARPGGLILAAEPNNIAGALILDSLNFHAPVDDIVNCVRLQLVCERGKAAMGEGNNSIGDLVPGLVAERGLVDVRVYLNDRRTFSFRPTTPASSARCSKKVPTPRTETSGIGVERTHVVISSLGAVARMNSTRSGQPPWVTATNLKRRLPTAPTPAAELPSNILSPAESRRPLRASDVRIAFP
jgi:SAM-dependent methyltransferase